MSADGIKTAAPPDDWAAEDEIDLRQYIGVLGRRWREIVAITLLVVVLAATGVFGYRWLSAPAYAASANVAIVRTLTDVKFDERYTTTSEEVTGQDVNSRRAALVGLVSSGAIAEQVIAQLRNLLSEAERNPSELLRMVEGELGLVAGRPGQSDLINIKVTAGTPEKAAAIANAWATAYVQQVNRIYGQVPDEMLGSVQSELNLAQVAYNKAQAELEAFLSDSQVESLNRQVTEKRNTIRALQAGKDQALQTYVDELVNSYQRIVQAYLDAQTSNQLLAFQKEQEGQRDLIGAYLDAYNTAAVDTFTEQHARDRALLRQAYDQWLQTTANLATARSLQEQLVEGGEGAVPGTALALQWLKLQSVYNAVSTATPGYRPSTTERPVVAQGTAQSLPDIGSEEPSQSTQAINIQMPDIQMSTGGNQPVIQVQLADVAGATLEEVSADVTGVVSGLQTQLGDLEQQIAALSQSLLSGGRYANLGATVPLTSTLVTSIEAQYPELFKGGVFAKLGEDSAADSTLAAAGQSQAAILFALGGLASLPTTGEVDAPMVAAIEQLENDVRGLQAQLEAETARNLQVTQQRDLSWDTYKALSSKQSELSLARAAANSEVRLGTPAVPPIEPVQGVSLTLSIALAGVIGLILALFVAFLLEYMGRPPLFTRAVSPAPAQAARGS